VDDVDDLLDAIAGPLIGEPGPGAQAVRTSVFRPKRGGYDEDAVDDYLDRVVELFLRREQLRAATARWSEVPTEHPSFDELFRRPSTG
jgi:DivIVA domain-containing protein